jgi:hypothetical protein
MTRRTPTRASRRALLAVRPLEGRIVPAFTLTIDGDPAGSTGINADTTTVPGTTIFSPTATGAVLDMDDIDAALATGDVLVTTGTGGAEAGNVNWVKNSTADDLVYTGFSVRRLTIAPDASSLIGNVTITGPMVNAGSLDYAIDTTAPATDGSILLGSPNGLAPSANINNSRSVTLDAGTSTITLNSFNVSAGSGLGTGNIHLIADTVNAHASPAQFIESDFGNVTIDARLDIGQDLTIQCPAGGTIILNGPVDSGALRLAASHVILAGDVGGTLGGPFLDLQQGLVEAGPHNLHAGSILIGTAGLGNAILTGTGTLKGDVTVGPGGTIAPGGLGTVGTLNVVGNLNLQGFYAADLGPTSDRIFVTGTVSLDPTTSRLGTTVDTGQLTTPGDVALISFPGTLTGTFANVGAEGRLFVLAEHPYQLTHYGPAASGLAIARAPAAPKGTVTGVQPDGTHFTARLTGGGELVAFDDLAGQLNVFTRSTTAKSKLTLTGTADASDDRLVINRIRADGPLAAVSAPTGILVGDLTAAGPVKAVTLEFAPAPITLGGSATDKTTVKVETLGGNLTTPGVVTSLTATGALSGSVTAAAVGTVKTPGSISGLVLTAGAVKSITGGDIQGMALTAGSVGSITTTGGGPAHLAGDLYATSLILTGDDGTRGHYGLKTLSVRGTVQFSTINVQAGNVGTVTVGRFIDSNLFLNYTPIGTFDTGGFDSAAHFKLTKFTTTAGVIGDPANPFNWSFAGSQIAADTIGTVKLSGLKTANFGAAFGIKGRTAVGTVQVTTADVTGDPDLSFNSNLATGAAALAGDFFYLDV